MSKGGSRGPSIPMTPDQVARLTELLSKKSKTRTRLRDLAMFRVMIDTVLRVSDIVNLTVGDVTDNQGNIPSRFVVRMIKTGKRVTCVLSEKTRNALSSWIKAYKEADRSSALFALTDARSVRYRVKEWCKLLGIDDTYISPHSMRKTKPTLVYRETRDLRSCQIMLGHASIGSTAVYLGIDREEAIAVFNQYEL